jgi:hypothetical protein
LTPGGIFAAGVVDIGGNLPPASLKPVSNLPPVSLTPVANLPPVSTTPAELVPMMLLIPMLHLDLLISPLIFAKTLNDPIVIFRGCKNYMLTIIGGKKI